MIEEKTRKTGAFWRVASPVACFLWMGAVGAARLLGAADNIDLGITLLGAAGLYLLSLLLGYVRDGRLAIVPLWVLAAGSCYAGLELLAKGELTWLQSGVGQLNHPLIHLFGLLWVAAWLLLFLAITGRLYSSLTVVTCCCIVMGLVSAVMLQFRGRMLTATDILSVTTAVSVSSGYTPKLTPAMVAGVVMLVLGWFALWPRCKAVPLPQARWSKLTLRLGSLALAGGYAAVIFGTYTLWNNQIYVYWNENSFEESFPLYFMNSLGQLAVDKPEGYDESSVEELAAQVTASADSGDEAQTTLASTAKKPTVIAIMSEAFSDPTVLGDFETDSDYFTFFNNWKKESVHGYVTSSVFGGGTANSEFEFLTGNTMGFLDSSVMPYQVYLDYNIDSLVSVLAGQGYETTVLHPYDISGYNRKNVYTYFGFDHMYFVDDFQNLTKLRGFATDQSNYENLIRLYEARDKDTPNFFFNITMQNHGTYTNEYYQSTVHIKDHEGQFPWAEQYLSLIKETDAATEKLIDYFRQQDDPVILLFFGDHQPKLDDGFYTYLFGADGPLENSEDARQKQLTPFYIWANFDIGGAQDLGTTSINYLSSLLLEKAGLEESPFQSFLSQLREKYPSINAYGYTDAAGNWYPIDSDVMSKDEDLKDYQMFEYNYLFDTSGYLSDFFALPGKSVTEKS